MSSLAAIGLELPKTKENIGSVLRAAMIYDVRFVAVRGDRYKKAATDTPKAWRHLPLIHAADLKDAIPFGCVPVAVDLVDGAVPLPEYEHPKMAYYVFGPEDGTLGERVLSWCRDVVYVPGVVCSNLAACVNVVLYDRMVKLTKGGFKCLPRIAAEAAQKERAV